MGSPIRSLWPLQLSILVFAVWPLPTIAEDKDQSAGTKQATAQVSVAQVRDAKSPDPLNGFPFGPVDDQDVDRLEVYAKEHGVDLKADLNQAYSKQGDQVGPSDEEALGRVFRFATQLQTLDKNARTYGHIIYCTFLNLGETWGIKRYARVVKRQNPGVQQRVRDFMLYAAALATPEEKDQILQQTKHDYPELFPASYEFGHDNPLIATHSSKQQCSCAMRRDRFGRRCRRW